MGHGWTQDDEIKCRQMKLEGKTSGQMAVVLGRSRNSILGFMNRKGISGQSKRTQTHQTHHAVIRRVIKKQQEERQRFKDIMKSSGPNIAMNKHPEFNRTDGIPMEDLLPNQCRWPVTPEKPFRFCSSTTDGRPYCELHDRLAHNHSCPKNQD